MRVYFIEVFAIIGERFDVGVVVGCVEEGALDGGEELFDLVRLFERGH